MQRIPLTRQERLWARPDRAQPYPGGTCRRRIYRRRKLRRRTMDIALDEQFVSAGHSFVHPVDALALAEPCQIFHLAGDPARILELVPQPASVRRSFKAFDEVRVQS